MRIAMISTPFIAVPPPRYGGTELVVWELSEGLREAGHEVTLFTVAESSTQVSSRALYRNAVWPPNPYHELNHAAWAMAEVCAEDEPFDVIHTHAAASLPLARFAGTPMVYTIHHERDEMLTAFYGMQRGVRLVAVSDRQRALLPELESVDCVHHGLDPYRYPLGEGEGRFALFLGRLASEKGPHVAIDVARQAGVPLTLAGEAHWKDRSYFNREVAPRLVDGGVDWVGEVCHAEKVPLLAQALALLFPIDWEEPFGLVMIEAMMCGAPVLAFGRGSVLEIIDEGITGWVCADEADMTARLKALAKRPGRFDRLRCRERAIERFGRSQMVRHYVDVYSRVAALAREPASHEQPIAPRL